MPTRSIVVAAFGGVVFLALVWLSIKVNAKPKTGASDAELAQARAFFKRNKSGVSSSTTRPTTRPPSRINRRRPPRTRVERKQPPVRRRTDTFDRPRTRPSNIRLSDRRKRGVELRNKMREANRAYDRQDYDEATKQAVEILKTHPRNVRMLRVVVSSACFMGDADRAQKYYSRLPRRDKAHMRIRCSRMKIDLDKR